MRLLTGQSTAHENTAIHMAHILCSHLEGNPLFKFESRGKIMIKGLGERQTFFVELAEKDEATRPKKASIRIASEDTKLSEINLVKMPALTRNKKLSPFSEEEKKGSGLHSPVVVDMVKPQAPLEEAWRPSQTSHTSSESVELQATSRSTRVTPATESADHSKTSPHKTNASLFIASGSNTEPEREQRTSRGKCILC